MYFVDDYRYRLFLVEPSWTSDIFLPRNVPFLLRLCSLTLHDIRLTTRGRRGFMFRVFFFVFYVFVMVSNAVDTM